MSVVIVALLIIVLCFGGVVFFGAPYLPTLHEQMVTALELADLEAGQTLLELGCGDGRVLVAAAQRGWRVVGYELNPLLVIVCKLRTWRYRHLVTVQWGDFLRQDWPPVQAIFIFGLKSVMPKLDKKIMQFTSKPVKLVSFAFELPQKTPKLQKNGLFLYIYD